MQLLNWQVLKEARCALLQYLLVELDVLQDLDGLVVVSQQGMETQQPHQTEVSQHLIQRVATVLPGNTLWVTCVTKHMDSVTPEGYTAAQNTCLHKCGQQNTSERKK